MPILIKQDIPAYKTLQAENIFVMNEERASSQDIRPIEVAILNLMPTKLETETQLLRMLSNTPLQVNVTFLQPKSHKSKNTSLAHLEKFYTTFDQVKDKRFDGMIITGAPVEQLEFEQVDYWEELKEILDLKIQLIREKIKEQPDVTITYFIPDDKKQGGKYKTVTNSVKKIDTYKNEIILIDGTTIAIDEIIDINSEIYKLMMYN